MSENREKLDVLQMLLQREMVELRKMSNEEHRNAVDTSLRVANWLYHNMGMPSVSEGLNGKLFWALSFLIYRGKFLETLTKYVRCIGSVLDLAALNILHGFVLWLEQGWIDRYQVAFGTILTQKQRVYDMVAVTLYRYRKSMLRMDTGTVFDSAMAISLVSYLLNVVHIDLLYDDEAIEVLEQLYIDDSLQEITQIWVQKTGLGLLHKGFSYSDLSARFADYLCTPEVKTHQSGTT